MSFYQTLWKDEKNRTLLISIIITIGALILAILFASYSGDENTPGWLQGLYEQGEYRIGLTILIIVFLMILHFFFLIAIATFAEIRAIMPSWGTLGLSAIFTLLITWMVVSIKIYGGSNLSNFTNGMKWTIFGVMLGFIVLTITYVFFTETKEKEEIVVETTS